MYSGKTFDMTLTATLNDTVVATYPVHITVGTFGEIHFGIQGRVIMENAPSSTLSIAAYANIVEMHSGVPQIVMHVPDNTIVQGYAMFSDSESSAKMNKSYDDQNGIWTFTVPPYDPFSPVAEPWWAKGKITIGQRIMQNWYPDYTTKDIVFVKYINFYSGDYQASGKSLAVCAVNSGVMYCTNSIL